MAQFKQWFTQDLTESIVVRHCESVMFTGDDKGAVVGVRLYDNGAAYSGGGTVTGAVKRLDGGLVALTGTLSGNAASVVIPAVALAYPGPIGVHVVLTQGGSTTTVLKAIYSVDDNSGAAVDPGTIIPSINDLISAIESAVASIPSDYSALLHTLAPDFSASKAYFSGDYVWYNGTLYRFISDHAAGSWTGTDATAAVVGNDLSNLKSAFEDLKDGIPMLATYIGKGNWRGTTFTTGYPHYDCLIVDFPDNYDSISIVMDQYYAYCDFRDADGNSVTPSPVMSFENNYTTKTQGIKKGYLRLSPTNQGGSGNGVTMYHDLHVYVSMYVKKGVGINLFNKNSTDVKNGYYRDANNVERSLATFSYLYIDEGIEPESSYMISGSDQTGTFICYYNGDTFLSGKSTVEVRTSFGITTPENCNKICISYLTAKKDTLQVEKGSSVTPYVPYHVGINTDEYNPRSITRDKVAFDVSSTYFCTVGTNGTYPTFRSCFAFIESDTQYSDYDVYVLDGSYDIKSEFTAEERAVSGFIGLTIPRNTYIHGSDKSRVIIDYDNSETLSNAISTFNIKDNVNLKNLTIKAEWIRYVIHDDFSTVDFIAQNKRSYRYIEDVDFIGTTLSMGYCYGAGTKGGADWHFRNCRFINMGQEYCFSVHDYANGQVESNDNFHFDNCEFIASGTIPVRFTPMKGNQTMFASINNCHILGIVVDSTLGQNPTSKIKINGGGNTSGIVLTYGSTYDEENSFITLTDMTSARFNKGSEAISAGDYVGIEDTYKGFYKLPSASGAYGIALDDIAVGGFGYCTVIN